MKTNTPLDNVHSGMCCSGTSHRAHLASCEPSSAFDLDANEVGGGGRGGWGGRRQVANPTAGTA